METKKLTISGSLVNYQETEGQLGNVIFIHSNSSHAEDFKAQINSPLAKKYKMFAVDLPGHGGSIDGSKEYNYSLQFYKDVLTNFIDKLGLKNLFFVGHSLGGHIALQASPHLESLKGMLIFGTPPIGKPAEFGKAFLAHPFGHCFLKSELSEDEYYGWASASFYQANEPLINYKLKALKFSDPKLREGIAAGVMQQEYEDEINILENSKIPIQFIHGEHDAFISYEYIKELCLKLSSCQLSLLKNVGHCPQLEAPEIFNKILEHSLGIAFKSS